MAVIINDQEYNVKLLYDVVEENNKSDFVEKVQAFIDDEWRLVGGVSVVYGDDFFYYCQAIEKTIYIPIKEG